MFKIDSAWSQTVRIDTSKTSLVQGYGYSYLTYRQMFGAVLHLLSGAIVASVSSPANGQTDGASEYTNVIRTSIGNTTLFGSLDFSYVNNHMTGSGIDTRRAVINPIDRALSHRGTFPESHAKFFQLV